MMSVMDEKQTLADLGVAVRCLVLACMSPTLPALQGNVENPDTIVADPKSSPKSPKAPSKLSRLLKRGDPRSKPPKRDPPKSPKGKVCINTVAMKQLVVFQKCHKDDVM